MVHGLKCCKEVRIESKNARWIWLLGSHCKERPKEVIREEEKIQVCGGFVSVVTTLGSSLTGFSVEERTVEGEI